VKVKQKVYSVGYLLTKTAFSLSVKVLKQRINQSVDLLPWVVTRWRDHEFHEMSSKNSTDAFSFSNLPSYPMNQDDLA